MGEILQIMQQVWELVTVDHALVAAASGQSHFGADAVGGARHPKILSPGNSRSTSRQVVAWWHWCDTDVTTGASKALQWM